MEESGGEPGTDADNGRRRVKRVACSSNGSNRILPTVRLMLRLITVEVMFHIDWACAKETEAGEGLRVGQRQIDRPLM